LNSHGIDFKKREKIANNIFKSPDAKNVASSMLNYHIDYLILKPKDSLNAMPSVKFLDVFYKNSQIKILKLSTQSAEKFL